MGELENDMDELFQEAAAHYPLKTDNADWDKLLRKLNDATPLHIRRKATRYKKKLLWFILLFPVGWLYGPYYKGHRNNTVVAHNIDIVVNITNGKNGYMIRPHYHSYDSGSSKARLEKRMHSVQINISHIEKDILRIVPTYLDSMILTGDMAYKKSSTTNVTAQYSNIKMRADVTCDATKIPLDEDNHSSAGRDLQGLSERPIRKIDVIESNCPPKTATNNNGGLVSKNVDTAVDSPISNSNNNIKGKPLYISLITGIDGSSVKEQSIKKMGYSAGVLLGYNLGHRFGVEIGLSWEKKRYYTNGIFFDKGRAEMPSGTVLLGMNGQCTMLEVPVDIKYNFLQHKNGMFFATAGISSYFMNREGYNYDMMANGQQKSATVVFENTGNGFLSVASMSIGLERKLGKFVSFRTGPYLKVPWKGLGIGNLPITSAGVYFGITHYLP